MMWSSCACYFAIAVYASYIPPGRRPARTCIDVTRLALGALVEIDMIARRVAPRSLGKLYYVTRWRTNRSIAPNLSAQSDVNPMVILRTLPHGFRDR